MKASFVCLFLMCLSQTVSAEQKLTYGEVESLYSKTFSSAREFYVHLPESYSDDLDRVYPVLYVLHGQWDLLSTVAITDAISNSIPELIIIGVNSKGQELRPSIDESGSHNISGQQFSVFFLKELLPHLKQQYRIAEFSILSGHSNAGRFVLNSFLDESDLFNAYFAFSPSLEDRVINSRVSQNPAAFTPNQSILILTLANEGKHMQDPYDELVSLFVEARPHSSAFFHHHFPEESHETTKVISMLYGLETIFDGWKPTGAVQRQGLVGLLGHYASLSEKYGFKVQIPMHFMQRIAYFASASEAGEDHLKAAEIVKYSLDREPQSVESFVEIVAMLRVQGDEKAALRLTSYICEAKSAHDICHQG